MFVHGRGGLLVCRDVGGNGRGSDLESGSGPVRIGWRLSVEDRGRACRVIDRSGKSHLPRVKECRRRRCTEVAFEGSTVAAWAVGEEVEIERSDETGPRDESRQGEGCSRHRLYRIADADEERGVGKTA